MAATVKIDGKTATVRNLRWTGDPDLVARIVRLGREEVSGADPNPDHTSAFLAVEALGGEITSFDPTEELPEGAVP